MYIISKKALAKIEKLRPGIIRKIGEALICSTDTVNRQLRINPVNGDLTKLAAIEVLVTETGMAQKEIVVYSTQLVEA